MKAKSLVYTRYALNLSGFGGRGRDEPSAQRREESRQQIVKSSDGGRKRRGARRQHGSGPADGGLHCMSTLWGLHGPPSGGAPLWRGPPLEGPPSGDSRALSSGAPL
ncbi:unnamed protein product [Arctogadus glacialis]